MEQYVFYIVCGFMLCFVLVIKDRVFNKQAFTSKFDKLKIPLLSRHKETLNEPDSDLEKQNNRLQETKAINYL